ncbi:vitronectin [Culex quinquefasciatus]|uniref:Vitronectin n=1 Tax=Culex quinquefasciatus TaxID=7176 RepID=B0XCF9_CULQU|nr:vitronectin [Culex quinquefasciatus]|eukprot:XP_001867331.1 vitronectin [Culex quinquefasciatus]
MNPYCKLLIWTLALYLFGASCVCGAPARSAAKAFSRRTSPRRLAVTADPTDVLIIPLVSDQDAEIFLVGLGYNKEDAKSGSVVDARLSDSDVRSLTELIRKFQEDNGLEVNGVLDDETKLAIGSPHCGFRKEAAKLSDGDVMKWNKHSLTYRIHNFPQGKRSAIIRATLTRAFMEWSKVTPLDFTEVNDTDADIEISFGGRTHQQRGDFCVFPDPKTLAHAFFPEDGDIHFNTKYFFEDDDIKLEDFMDTALHEIGHALGLEHINSKASLMHPTESNQFTEPQPIDVERIQEIYGSRREGRMVRKIGPKLCTLSKIDAGIDDADGNRYLFVGEYYYDLGENRPKGRLISSKWPGLPGNIDAAVRYIDEKSYFFKGDKVWRFKGTRLESGYPRLISKAFPGIPSNIDAVLVDGEGDLYAFKGGKYWIYDVSQKKSERVSKGSVESLNLPDKLDAALDTESSMMVFKGQDVYVFQDDGTWEEEPNVWLGC